MDSKLNKVAKLIIKSMKQAEKDNTISVVLLQQTRNLLESQNCYESLDWALHHLNERELKEFSLLTGISIDNLMNSVPVFEIAHTVTPTPNAVLGMWEKRRISNDEQTLKNCQACDKQVEFLSLMPLERYDNSIQYTPLCKDCTLHHWQLIDLDDHLVPTALVS